MMIVVVVLVYIVIVLIVISDSDRWYDAMIPDTHLISFRTMGQRVKVKGKTIDRHSHRSMFLDLGLDLVYKS